MRIYLMLTLMFACSIAEAKSLRVTPTPNWYCFTGLDNNKQIATACYRALDQCTIELNAQELATTTTICYGMKKAFVSTIIHKSDNHIEYNAYPTLAACNSISQQMAADSPDVIVGPCILTL